MVHTDVAIGRPHLHPPRPPRYPLRLPVKVAAAKGRAAAEETTGYSAWTQNISGQGLFLEISSPLQPGSKLRVRLELPGTGSERVVVECACRVVRTALQNGVYGIGARIEDYEFIRAPQP